MRSESGSPSEKIGSDEFPTVLVPIQPEAGSQRTVSDLGDLLSRYVVYDVREYGVRESGRRRHRCSER
jgi:hypothetical protein